LNKRFLAEIKANSQFKSGEPAKRFLSILLANQSQLAQLIRKLADHDFNKTVASFYQSILEFAGDLLSVEGVQLLLEAKCDQFDKYKLGEILKYNVIELLDEPEDLDEDLTWRLNSLGAIAQFLVGPYNWSKACSELLGGDLLWCRIFCQWTPEGFNMLSTFCVKSIENNAFIEHFFEKACSFLYAALNRKLVNEDYYTNISEVLTAEFLTSVADLATCYDFALSSKRIDEAKFVNDFYPIALVIFNIFNHLPVKTCDVYLWFSQFFIRLFQSKTGSFKSIDWDSCIELIIQKMWKFYAEVETRRLNCELVNQVNASTVQLAAVFVDFYFVKELDNKAQRENYMLVVRDEVLRSFLNEMSYHNFENVNNFQQVLLFYKI
jgi:hypothetical protein